MRRGALIGCCLLALGAPAAAAGQQPRVSAFLPSGHWAIDAARRLHGLGLTPIGYDPASDDRTLAEVRAAFEAAAAASPLAAAYLARLEDELGAAADARDGLHTRVEVGAQRVRGAVAIGIGLPEEPDETGPVAYAPVTAPLAALEHFGSGEGFAWGGRVEATHEQLALREAYARTALGAAGVWLGVRAQGYATATGRGVVVTRTPARPGGGVHTVRPVRLPWVFRALGPVHLSTALLRLERNYSFDNPWFWSSRAHLAPHPRFQAAVTRAVMFGGEGNQELDLRTLAYMLIGKHSGGFDDQIVSITLRYRPPTDGVLPLLTYLEWGLEDSAGAWKDTPGVMAGVEAPSLPFAPAAALGASFTRFSASCCGNPYWYRNRWFRGGWADDGIALGHPLGGHGWEGRLYGRSDLAEARVQVTGEAFVRDRGRENIFAPDRSGGSLGGGVSAIFLWPAGRTGFLEVRGERGTTGDWDELALRAGVQVAL